MDEIMFIDFFYIWIDIWINRYRRMLNEKDYGGFVG